MSLDGINSFLFGLFIGAICAVGAQVVQENSKEVAAKQKQQELVAAASVEKEWKITEDALDKRFVMVYAHIKALQKEIDQLVHSSASKHSAKRGHQCGHK